MRSLAALVLAFLFGFGSSSAAENPRGDSQHSQDRIQYLERLMQALRETPETEFKQLAGEAEQTFAKTCRSSDPSLALSCAFEAAEKICKTKASTSGSNCLFIMDALIVERLNHQRFVSARERYEIMSQGSDYKNKLRELLHYRYGSLVQSFSLTGAAQCEAADLGCLAEGLERFCQKETRLGRLSYQTCSAVVALYIGTHAKAPL